MQSAILASVLALAFSQSAMAADAHGSGALGTVMGPVAFMWPSDRPWSASADNTAPCGSPSGPVNRTKFPLNTGSVALTIADEAYNVAFYLATGNNPTTQDDFSAQVVQTIPDIDPGHMCYKLNDVPSSITAGTNATIQMQYWADYEDGNDQRFYACADITFVDTVTFDTQIPCFNVTSSEFEAPEGSSSTGTTTTEPAPSSGGLSKGAIAGIAVGTVVGSLAIVGLVAFFAFRRRQAARAAEMLPYATKQPETTSIRSA